MTTCISIVSIANDFLINVLFKWHRPFRSGHCINKCRWLAGEKMKIAEHFLEKLEKRRCRMTPFTLRDRLRSISFELVSTALIRSIYQRRRCMFFSLSLSLERQEMDVFIHVFGRNRFFLLFCWPTWQVNDVVDLFSLWPSSPPRHRGRLHTSPVIRTDFLAKFSSTRSF